MSDRDTARHIAIGWALDDEDADRYLTPDSSLRKKLNCAYVGALKESCKLNQITGEDSPEFIDVSRNNCHEC